MRQCGILLPMSSLPNQEGIGTFGIEAFWWIDFLKKAGQHLWQLLPLCPTAYGNSPYQSPSLFAINPYYISLEGLKNQGLLTEDDLPKEENEARVDYGKLFYERITLLKKAYRAQEGRPWRVYAEKRGKWLCSYAIFMALKEKNGYAPWHTWKAEERDFSIEKCAVWQQRYQEEMDFWLFVQWQAETMWNAVHQYAKQNGVEIIGDMPLYPAYDSADVWANRDMFLLQEDGTPRFVAGCTPDSFSQTGQLWGNPVYDWKAMEQDDFAWWNQRFARNLYLYDTVRLDHVIGYFHYYQIPYGDETAQNGTWERAMGEELFAKLKQRMPHASFIAEDLGHVTEQTKAQIDQMGYPTMKVIQFAFETDSKNPYLPHNCPNNSVYYTGTHDNDTLRGWLEHLPKPIREQVFCYVRAQNMGEAVDHLIAAVLASGADRIIASLPDYLKEKTGRINTPGRLEGNWTWRLKKEQITYELALYMKTMAQQYGRD